MRLLSIVFFACMLLASCSKSEPPPEVSETPASSWYRPADNTAFNVTHGNNHDPIIFVDTTLDYPYHLIISGWDCASDTTNNSETTFLWRSKKFSWSSDDWELVSANYEIDCSYEYDDGIKVNGTYYLYDNGNVYTFDGPLEAASGQWKKTGTFPRNLCDDIGVYYEDGLFHLFGEYRDFPHGPDGTSLSHLTSTTGLGNWVLRDTLAVNPNIDGGTTYGVGDPTIIKTQDGYYLYCDYESVGNPYKIVAWKSTSLFSRFQKSGVAIEARSKATNNWDNHRVQDGDIAFIPELSSYVMVCNMKDTDGNPGGAFPQLDGFTRVVGVFYSESGSN